MCHVSVGHLARLIEEAGIPTVAIYVQAFAPVAERMRLPRVLVTRHPVGRPLGAPGDAEGQREVVSSALGLLESASSPLIVVADRPYRVPAPH